MAADNTTLTKLFQDIADAIRSLKGTTSTYIAANFPKEITSTATSMASTTASAADVLSGKTAYLNKVLTTGTMPDNGTVTQTLSTQGASYTIPKGYHSGSGKITANINNATITSGSGTITITGPTYNSTNANFTIGTSVAIAAPTVGTAGYISSSAGTKNSNSASKTLTLNKIGIAASITNGGATTPVISRTAKPSADTWVDAASGASVTTKPTSGPYVQVDVAALTKTLTATPSVSSAGYGTTTSGQYTPSNATATVGHNKATTAYIPITTTSASRSTNVISYGTGWITEGTITVPAATIKSGTVKPTLTGPTYNSTNANFTITASGTVTAPTVSTEGYISSSLGTKNTNTLTENTLTLSKIVVQASKSGDGTTKPIISRTAKPSADTWIDAASDAATTTTPSSGPYVQVNVAAISKTITITPSVKTAGYGTTSYYESAGNISATAGHSASDATYIPIKQGSSTAGVLTLTNNGSSLTVPTASSSNYIFAATAKMTASTIAQGWQEAKTVTAADNKSITFTMPTAVLGVNTSGGSGQPTLSTTTEAISDITNAAGGAAVVSPTSGGVYVKVSSASSTISNSVTPKITTAGYTPTKTGSTTTFNSTIEANEVYVPITTTSASLSGATTSWGTGWITAGSKTVASGSATTPTTTISGTPTLTNSSGTFSLSFNKSESITPTVSAGYITKGTAGTVTAKGTATYYATSLDSNLKGDNIVSGVTIFGVSGKVSTVDLTTTANTFTQVNNFSASSAVTNSSSTGTITLSAGGLVAASGIKGAKVYNAVWNDLADLIPVDEECELEFGRCYCFNGSHYYKSRKYLDDGIIGIHSDTAGFEMGHKDEVKELKCSVAGFVLAYVDQDYEVGTLLTCGENGTLTKISNEDKLDYPEKIVASYWKDEKEEYWGSETKKVLVDGRKWVKVK